MSSMTLIDAMLSASSILASWVATTFVALAKFGARSVHVALSSSALWGKAFFYYHHFWKIYSINHNSLSVQSVTTPRTKTKFPWAQNKILSKIFYRNGGCFKDVNVILSLCYLWKSLGGLDKKEVSKIDVKVVYSIFYNMAFLFFWKLLVWKE